MKLILYIDLRTVYFVLTCDYRKGGKSFWGSFSIGGKCTLPWTSTRVANVFIVNAAFCVDDFVAAQLQRVWRLDSLNREIINKSNFSKRIKVLHA